MRIVADYLLFDQLSVNLYELDDWLADEVREVLIIVRQNQPKPGSGVSRGRETGLD